MFGLIKRPANARPSEAPDSAPSLKVLVDEQICHHCGACVAVCPPDAIFLETSFLRIDQDTCTACTRCVRMCPVHALAMAQPHNPSAERGMRHA